MKINSFCWILILSLSFSQSLFAQLSITSNLTATQYAQDLVGSGVTISNATITGAAEQFGEFTNGSTTNLGMNQGIILCTGGVSDIPQAQEDGLDVSEEPDGSTPDSALEALGGGSPYDEAVLSFDFVPQGPTVKFQFIFGSEEYSGYVGSTYNDAFGFFLSGPGISGPFSNNSENLAVVPGTSTKVSINTINDGPSLFSDCPPSGTGATNPQYYVNNCGGTTIVYNGFTKVLTATATVQCNQTYHMKIAIADISDGEYDSGVFIKKSSLSSPSVNITPQPVTLCKGQSVTLTGYIINPNGGSFSWQPGGQTDSVITASPDTTTHYIINYTKNGCVSADTALVTVDSIPTITTTNDSICPGGTGTITATATPPGGTFSWSPGGSTSASMSASPSSTTDYTVAYTKDGCSDTATATIAIVTIPPTVTVQGGTICNGGSITLTASATPSGGTFSWSPGGQTTDSITVSPTTTTTYTVTYTSPCGTGTATDTANVVVNNSNPTVIASPDTAICLGDSITLTANAGSYIGTYTWNPGNLTGDSIIVSPNVTTTYQVIFNSSFCSGSDTDTTVVTIKSIPSVSVVNDTICPGETGTLNSNVNPTGGTYFWSPGGGTGASMSATIDSTKNYLLTYTANGCQDTASGIILVRNATVSITGGAICQGSSFNLTAIGNPSGGTYSWSPGFEAGNSISVSPSITTTYTVTYTAANNCEDSDTAIVAVNPIPVVSFNGDTICAGTGLTLTASATPSGGNFLWSPGNDSTASILISPTTTTTYIVSYTSLANCSSSDTETVIVNPIPTLSTTGGAICPGDSFNLIANASPSGGTYLWMPGNGNNSSYTVLPPSTTTYFVNYTDSNGCSNSDSAIVTVKPKPVAAFSYSAACAGVLTQFTDGSTIGNNGTINFWDWNFGTTPSSSSTNQNPSNVYNDVGTYLVTLIVKSSFGCSDTISDSIKVNPIPIANFSALDRAGCTPWCVSFTDSSTIASGNINSWSWNLGNGATPSGQTVSGCYHNDGLGINSYDISLIVTSDKGCSDTATKNNYVTVYPQPEADFKASPNPGNIYHEKIHFINLSNGTDQWVWSFGDGDSSAIENPIHNYQDTGSYIVKQVVTNQWGCKDSIEKTVRINPLYDLFIPNAFTPDGDGKNDVFFAKGFGIKGITMYIFDRWGNMLFTGNGIEPKWDGLYKGELVPPDVYVYKIIAIDFKGDSHIYIGSVTVVR